MKYLISITVLLIFLCSCNHTNKRLETPNIEVIATPCSAGGASNLFVNDDHAFLSWVEYTSDTTDALMFSELIDNNWSEAKEIASGNDWFVNWADFPSIVMNNNTLAAHWLQKSANGTYDYDVRIAQSNDIGNTWSPSFIIHRDSIAAEHGFVSMLPLENGKIFATWLDGRNTKVNGEPVGHGHNHHSNGGAMTLRTAEFDAKGNITAEAELDDKICDCCQTSAALIENGIVVAYRDRSDEEIRDISIVRKVDDKWSAPMKIGNDNWKIAGCPVNGPSIAAQGKNVAIVWYTMADEKPVVNMVFSTDNAESFGTPIQVDEGNPLGRVDVVFDTNDEVLVSWMEKKEEDVELRAVRMNASGKMGDSFLITKTSESRKSGFPIMKKYKDDILVSWTKVDNSSTSVNSAILSF